MQTTSATILIIERHPLMRAALVNALVDESDLTLAAVASEVDNTLRIVESLRPDIILFSIGNPGGEDLEAMRELRTHSADTALLALTTSEVPGQDESAFDHGADAVLTKTAPRAELLQALRAMKANKVHGTENAANSPRRDAG